MTVTPKQYQLKPLPASASPAGEHHRPVHAATQAPSSWSGLLRRWGEGVLWLEPLWLAVLAPSLLARDYLWDAWVQPWLVAALFLFWPLRVLTKRRLSPYTPFMWPMALLLGWSGVGVIVSPDPERSWTLLGYLAFGITLSFALVNWSLTQRYTWLLVALLAACGLGLAALGPSLLINISDEFFIVSDEYVQSKPLDLYGTGETVNPNVLGGMLAILIPLFLALSLRWDFYARRWQRYGLPILWGLLTVGMTATLIVAQSRGAYVAAFVGICAVLIARWPWSAVVLAVAGCAAAVVLAGNGAFAMLEAVGASGSITSLSGRWEVWERALYALQDFPLTGIGLGVFDLVIPYLYPYIENGNGAQIPHAHNLWLQVGVDLGVPGLLLYTWLLVSLVRGLLQQIRRASQTWQATQLTSRADFSRKERHERRGQRRAAAQQWTLAVGLLGSFTALLIDGVFDAVTWGTKPAVVHWLLVSLAALLYQTNSARPSADA